MGISVLVLYPKTDDSKFDMDYYKTSHMPMVAEEFSSYGFKGKQASKNLLPRPPHLPYSPPTTHSTYLPTSSSSLSQTLNLTTPPPQATA